MNAKTTEVWTTTTAKGSTRYWKWSHGAFRAVPVKRTDAELGLMAGTHIMGTKPMWVGK